MQVAEKQTDMVIYSMMKNAGIEPYAEKSPILEVQNALKSASKRGTNHVGKPEFTAQVGNFLIIVEDKKESKFQANYMRDKSDTLMMDTESVVNYAENGALHYAQHIASNTNFKKIFAFGCSGSSEDRMTIRPIYVTDKSYRIMPKVKDFSDFTEANINTYYSQKVLENKTVQAVELEDILSRSRQLNEDLRNYAQMGETEKPLIVSSLLLALREDIDLTTNLKCDSYVTDGEIVYQKVCDHMRRVNVVPEKKKERVLHQFQILKLRPQLSAKHPALGMSPLRYFAEYINSKVFAAIANNTRDDVLGRFYGEFLRYGGGDGQNLGVVLTPSHITELMAQLIDIKDTDTILDPCCGTGAFLIEAMRQMLKQAGNDDKKKEHIRKEQLHGIELRDDMFSIATTNMILRGDGKSKLDCADFLATPLEELRSKCCNKGLMNPPYSQAKNKLVSNLSELSFILHLLDSLVVGGRAAVIVPQSTMVGKTKTDKDLKEVILSRHTLEGVITLNTKTFYPVGTNPVIAVFTTGKPHPKEKYSKFFNFKDDGYDVMPHVGLMPDDTVEEKYQHLIDCWANGKTDHTSFMVTSKVEPTDEWLHSFYYFNDEIPEEEDFEKAMADYLSFEFKMIISGRGDLFNK